MSNQEIIVPVEWSPRSLAALTPTNVLARQTGRGVHIVSIVPRESDTGQRRGNLEKEAERRGIASPRITVLHADLNTVPIGEEDGTLMRVIRDSPDAMVCMATHARNAIGDILLGSVASDILNGSDVPVVLTGPQFSADWQGPLNTILVCLDGSTLSEAIIDQAASLAKATKASLMLVQVQSPEAHQMAATQDAAETGYLQSKAADIHKRHGLDSNWDVLHGKDPAKAIAEYVASYPGAMVAMTTHGHTGMRKLAFGSVARDVVHGINCPVLAFRPKG